MTRNITLRLDEAILRKAKHTAVEQDQSLSEWVAGVIVKEISGRDRYSSARQRALKRLKRGLRLGGKPLTREQTHER